MKLRNEIPEPGTMSEKQSKATDPRGSTDPMMAPRYMEIATLMRAPVHCNILRWRTNGCPRNPRAVKLRLNNLGMDLVTMSGVGHFSMTEDPETFNALLSFAIADFAN